MFDANSHVAAPVAAARVLWAVIYGDGLCLCYRSQILFVGPTHDDPEGIIRQWPLQRLRLIPRMDRLDHGVGGRRQEALQTLCGPGIRFGLW